MLNNAIVNIHWQLVCLLNLITGYATITMHMIWLIVSLLYLLHVCFITDQIVDQASITATVETIEMRKCDAYEDTSLPRRNVVVMEDNPAYATFATL